MENYKEINKTLFRIISFVIILYILFLPINNKSKNQPKTETKNYKDNLANFFKAMEANPLILYENQPKLEFNPEEKNPYSQEKNQTKVEVPNVLVPLSE
jgi:hypothetical protein